MNMILNVHSAACSGLTGVDAPDLKTCSEKNPSLFMKVGDEGIFDEDLSNAS